MGKPAAEAGYEVVLEADTIKAVKSQALDAAEGIQFPEEVIAFPGLINAHEHLANNTHPLFKKAAYPDYTIWAEDVTKHIQKEVQSIPFPLRYQWGLLKNLLNGFTTIVQHDRFLPGFESEVADIHNETRVIHSLAYDNRWRLKANWPEKQWKVIHLAEGISPLASSEPERLLKWTLKPKQILAVHGVSLQPKQAAKLGGLIWCPNSNLALYGHTADITRLKDELPILFGTDSTISADWNLRYHLKQARETGMLTDEALYEAATSLPAEIFGFTDRAELNVGRLADLVVARKKHNDLWDAFYETGPEDILLVIKSGKVVMADQSVSTLMGIEEDSVFEKVSVGNSIKLVRFEFSRLSEAIKAHYPDLITAY